MARYIVIEAIEEVDLGRLYADIVVKARELAGLAWVGCVVEPVFIHGRRLVVRVNEECLKWVRASMVFIDGAVTVKVTGTLRKAKAQALSIPPIFRRV